VVWRRPEFDERMDGIVYASRGGLGFALVENVLYLLNQHSLQGQIVVWVERALLAVPGHAMWTGMIGAMAARRRFDGSGLGLLGGYLLADPEISGAEVARTLGVARSTLYRSIERPAGVARKRYRRPSPSLESRSAR
jgi:hypothetical protein